VRLLLLYEGGRGWGADYVADGGAMAVVDDEAVLGLEDVVRSAPREGADV
jgi:hypothetical protein